MYNPLGRVCERTPGGEDEFMINRREWLGTMAASTSLPAGTLMAMQGVQLSELRNPVDLNALRQKYQAGDPIYLQRLRTSRWSPARAFQYMERFGVVKGVNYSTRMGGVFQDYNERLMVELFGTSGGRPGIEFPPTHFNEKVIQQELGWAQTVVGLTSIRLFMSMSQYQTDRELLFRNFERVLDICASKGLSVMPVIGGSVLRDPDAKDPEPERPPRQYLPGVFGGGGAGGAGGGRTVTWDTSWPKYKPLIKDYLQTFIRRYANDKRIILWDLINEPPTAQRPLAEYLYQWAREVDPTQPLSACWNCHDLSDVITFHTYMRPGLNAPEGAPARVDFLTELNWARAWKRPILCTEWLARPFGSTVDNTLPFFSRYGIGWYSFGLVTAGPSNHQYPWNWPVGSPEPPQWFHGLLYPDGRPYSYEEVLKIRDFKYQTPPEFVKTQSYWADGSDVTDKAPPVD